MSVLLEPANMFGQLIEHLKDRPLGFFGVGELGKSLVEALLQAGFPTDRILLSHGGSPVTRTHLVGLGLGDRIVDSETLAQRSGVVLCLLRPQDGQALQRLRVSEACLLVSFMAAVKIRTLVSLTSARAAVRVLISSPDTIRRRSAIAAAVPAGNEQVLDLIRGLSIKLTSLREESQMHAYTSLGPCLPTALALFRARGGIPDDSAILLLAEKHGLPDYRSVLQWAHQNEPSFSSIAEREAYIKRAATPGGVTEAILACIEEGGSLIGALEEGIRRSVELSDA